MTLSFNNLGNMGRLGNQMFQFAALYGISSNMRYQFMVPKTNIELYDEFDIPNRIGLSSFKTISPESFGFDKKLFERCSPLSDLCGYFQTEKYFLNQKESIKLFYTFKPWTQKIAKHYLDSKFREQEVISIHIRRGDYLTDDGFVNLSLTYYENALKILPERNVLIFSDDIEWCKLNFIGDKFTFIDTSNHFLDLCLMSMCHYHVIANSSFSWWGSWLSTSKKTIAPTQWFDNHYKYWDIIDIYCPNWKIL